MRRTRDIIRRNKLREKSKKARHWLKASAVATILAPMSVAEVAYAKTAATAAHDVMAISEQDVLDAQQKWAAGIVAIGEAFQNGEDYNAVAADMIRELYAYEQLDVLFKPTLADEQQFRPEFEDALSYFVAGEIEEDKGFAIRPWSSVRFGDQQIMTLGDSALSMGNYYFTPVGDTEEVKVEFSFGYVRDSEGAIRIVLHHSSVPYSAG